MKKVIKLPSPLFSLVSFFLFFIIQSLSNLSYAFDSTDFVKGKPIFIQVFKTEAILELYQEDGNAFKLIKTYPICKFSGGLGPKKRQGDFKSPEGFYDVSLRHLKPDSQYHRAINIGFPNEYDKQYGYTGDYLMIHGNCVSVGCYAMEDGPIEEIYDYAEAALLSGQEKISIHIYPFKMTDANLAKYAFSENIDFWKQLAEGYRYFQKHNYPAQVDVNQGKYVVSQMLPKDIQLANKNSINTLLESKPKSSENMLNSIESSQINRKIPNQQDEANLLNSIKLAKENNH